MVFTYRVCNDSRILFVQKGIIPEKDFSDGLTKLLNDPNAIMNTKPIVDHVEDRDKKKSD